MCRWEPSASSSSSARALWHRISTFGGLRGAQDAKKTRSRALSAGQYHPMGLYAHICTYKCAAGSPTSAAAAEREHLCTELALFAGCGAHKKPKTRSRALSAGQSHHVGLNAQICTSKCAAGPPRSPEPSRARVAEQRPLLSPLPMAIYIYIYTHMNKYTYIFSSSSARALWHRISTFGGLRGAQDAKKTRSRALSAGQYHPMGLYAHICTYKCAAGSPTSARNDATSPKLIGFQILLYFQRQNIKGFLDIYGLPY